MKSFLNSIDCLAVSKSNIIDIIDTHKETMKNILANDEQYATFMMAVFFLFLKNESKHRQISDSSISRFYQLYQFFEF